jgi:hypothetical protein
MLLVSSTEGYSGQDYVRRETSKTVLCWVGRRCSSVHAFAATIDNQQSTMKTSVNAVQAECLVLGNLFLINIRVSPTHFPQKRCSIPSYINRKTSWTVKPSDPPWFRGLICQPINRIQIYFLVRSDFRSMPVPGSGRGREALCSWSAVTGVGL